MKIKKRTNKNKKPSAINERKVFFAVFLIIVLVDLFLLGVVFPNIKDMLLAPGQDTDSAGGAQMSMAMIIILVDIVLVVPLYMIFNRIVTKRTK